MTIKSTYTLDPSTVRAIEEMASDLGISKSEVLRRAMRLARGHDSGGGALAALAEIQSRIGLKPAAARSWAAEKGAERRAASTRRESSVR